MSLRLPADIYSSDQLSIIALELDRLVGALRDAAVRAQVVSGGAEAKDVHVSAPLLGVLHTAGVSAANRQALEVLLAEIQAVRERAPVVHLIFGALPTRTFKRQLVEWFRDELHPQLLLTFATRTDIGGGFILRAGSRQYDFTYKARLLENKHRISEIFDSVRQ